MPGNIFLYKQAFRHKSAAKEVAPGVKDSNERLEYLGDAILGAIAAEYLFKKYPYREEGFLTEARSKIVSRVNLNRLARKMGMDKILQTTTDLTRTPSHSLFGDAFEAVIGAIYLDKGYNFTKKVVVRNVIEMHLNIEELVQKDINFKSKIIEWAQREKKIVEFRLEEEIVLKNNQRQYRVSVVIENRIIEESIDFSIKGAEQRAAEKAIKILGIEEDQ